MLPQQAPSWREPQLSTFFTAFPLFPVSPPYLLTWTAPRPCLRVCFGRNTACHWAARTWGAGGPQKDKVLGGREVVSQAGPCSG